MGARWGPGEKGVIAVADRSGREEGKEKAYEVWIGFIVDAAFTRGDADFEGERSIPDALLEDCGGCHLFCEARDGLGLRGAVGTKALLSDGCGWVSSLLWARRRRRGYS